MRLSCFTSLTAFILLVFTVSGSVIAEEPLDTSLARSEPIDSVSVFWYDIRHCDVEGRGWTGCLRKPKR